MLSTIILLRHGESADKQPGQLDFDRSLTKLGRRSISQAGLYLKEEKLIPDFIISSNAKRTIETTQAISSVLEIPFDIIIYDPLLYQGSDKDYHTRLSLIDASFKLVLMVGHNPSISSLIGRLTGSYSTALHAGQAALIQFTTHANRNFEGSVGRLTKLIGPFLK